MDFYSRYRLTDSMVFRISPFIVNFLIKKKKAMYDIRNKKSIDRFDNVIHCHLFFYQASWKLFYMNGEILNTIESVKRYITPISGIKNPLIGLIIRTYNTLPFFFLSGKLKIILYEWRNSEHHRVSQTISGIKNPLIGLIIRTHNMLPFFFFIRQVENYSVWMEKFWTP